VTYYVVSFAENMGPIQTVNLNILSTSYTVTNLNSGSTYNFWVQSVNSYGISAYSDTLQLVCGFKPSAPAAPVTSVIADKVIITWQVPVTNGASITKYRISIKQKDGTYSEQLQYCDGS